MREGICLLRTMMHELTWVDSIIPGSDLDPDSFKSTIGSENLPKLNRIVVLAEMYPDPNEMYIWVLAESYKESKWIVLAHIKRRVMHGDWVGKIRELYNTFKADYIWVTQRSIYAALKLARLNPQLMGQTEVN
jgi:hypothetical protein